MYIYIYAYIHIHNFTNTYTIYIYIYIYIYIMYSLTGPGEPAVAGAPAGAWPAGDDNDVHDATTATTTDYNANTT